MTTLAHRAALLAASAMLCLPAAAQTPTQTPAPVAQPYAVPRTPYGHPSFEGVWTSNFILMLESTPQAPMLTLPEPAAKRMADMVASMIATSLDKALDPEIPVLIKNTDGLGIVRGERRTRMVVLPADGKLPYTPEARKEAARGQGMGGFNNPEERPNWERCIASMGRAPIVSIGESNPRQFIQTPTQVVIHTEYGAEARIIPFTDTHRPAIFKDTLGDSIARWEGDTLVIETVRMSPADRVRLFPTLIVPHEAKVIERYTRISDDELLYQFTVEDPSVYTAPWLAEYSIYRTDQRLYEHACHEGNYAMANVLKGQRVADVKAARSSQLAEAKR